MKSMIFVTLAAMVATAMAGSQTYGPPSYQEAPQTRAPQVFRHVYIHAAPEEPVERQSRVIRVPGNQDKHVNIIFVKTPTNDFQQETEVILPEQGEQKTLVYVLSKKGESTSDVKIRGPAPTQPSKPEVYFIRYKNNEEQPRQSYGAPAPAPQPQPVRTSPPRSSYGAPF